MPTRIMVIDDEPLIGQLLNYQLSGAGYAVSVYQDAAEALAQFAFDQPALVLLDVMMPGVSGWDVCRQIRAASDVPVIMLTAKSADDDVVTGLTQGADDYICKPFTERQLLARIGAVLRRAGAHAVTTRHPARPAAPAASTRPYPAPAVRSRAVAALPALAQPSAGGMGAQLPASPALPLSPAPPPQHSHTPAAPPRLGHTLAAARRERGMSLHQAEHACGVRWEFLQAIEQEQYTFMPRLELRAALRAYSDMLGIDLGPYLGRRARRRLSDSFALTMIVAALCLLTLLLLAL